MKLSQSNFDAAIFDIDGTMVDNMSYHLKAWQEFCKRYGIKLTKDKFRKKLSGRKNEEYFDILFNQNISDAQKQKLADEKETLYRKIYKPHLKEIIGLRNLLKKLKGFGIVCAVATTAPLKNRWLILNGLSLSPYFSLVLGEENVNKGKPNPEIFLKVAKNLKVNPDRCIVFEDSPVGIEAAKKANMYTVALLTTHNREELKGAGTFIKDFSEIEFQE